MCATGTVQHSAYSLMLCPQQSVHENRIYSVNIHCGDDYPDKPPTVQFVSKVNLPCVDQRNGKVDVLLSCGIPFSVSHAHRHQVDPSKLPCTAQWKRDYTMETILIELRRQDHITSTVEMNGQQQC